MSTLEKYIWVANVLYNAGDKGLTLKELNEKWFVTRPLVMANLCRDKLSTDGKEIS